MENNFEKPLPSYYTKFAEALALAPQQCGDAAQSLLKLP